MKYLIFNAAVFLALAYLIVGGNETMVQNLTREAPMQQVSQPLPSKPIVEKVVEQEAVQPTPKPVIETVVAKKPKVQPVETVKPAAPPAIPKPVEVAKLAPKKVPSRTASVVENPAPVVAEVSPPVVEAKTDDGLMDAKERSRELRQMVADMEQMFAEKMTR